MGVDLTQLNHLLARFNHGSANLVSTRKQDTFTIFASCTPSPDCDFEIGKPGPEPLAEMTCLRQSAGRYGCDTNHGRTLLANPSDTRGGEHRVGHDLDFIWGGIKQLTEQEKCQFVRLVLGRTSHDENFWNDNRGVSVGGRRC